MPIKVSVIVPIYNIEKYLKKCVDSVLSQSYVNVEVILVDDGSIDVSSEECDLYAQLDTRIITVHKENGGLTSARKTGIIHSTGDFITIVDGDDWIDIDAIDILTDKICQNPELDLIIFSHQKEYPNNSYSRYLFDKDTLFDTKKTVQNSITRRLFGLTNEELSFPLKLDYLSTCWGKVYRRNLVLQAKFVDTTEVGSGEDGIFNIYALDSCQKALYVDQPFYHYRYTFGSLTSRYRYGLIYQWKKLFSYMQKKIDEDGLSSDFQEALNNRIALSVIGIGMNEMDNPDGSFLKFTEYMKLYISSSDYRTAIATMRIKKLPFVWKILMICCKCRFAFGLSVILKAIRVIKSKL